MRKITLSREEWFSGCDYDKDFYSKVKSVTVIDHGDIDTAAFDRRIIYHLNDGTKRQERA